MRISDWSSDACSSDLLRLAWAAAEVRTDHDRALGQSAVSIAVVEIGEREHAAFARAQHHLSLAHYVLDLAAVSAAVPAHEAADGTGHRAQEFVPRHSRVTPGGADANDRSAAAAVQPRPAAAPGLRH